MPNMNSIGSSSHVVISFLIGVILACIQIQYQSSEDSPFDKYYGTIKSMLFSTLCLYAGGYMLESKLEAGNSIWLPTVKIFTRLFGFLVVIMLIILMLPWFGLFLLILWAFLFGKAVPKSYHEVWEFLKGQIQGIMREHFGRDVQNELPTSSSSAVNVSNS